MADIVSIASYTALQEILAAGNAAVSGMSLAEAQAALGATATSGLYALEGATAAGAGSIIQFPGATAAQAFAGYTASGGTTAISGAATAATGAAKQVANLTLIKGAGTGAASKAGLAGLLTVPVPNIVAAIAPLAGGAILGGAFYSLFPEFTTKVSQAILPFCYDGSFSVPVPVDEQGQTWLPTAMVDALVQAFEEEGWWQSTGKTSPVTPGIASLPTASSVICTPYNPSSFDLVEYSGATFCPYRNNGTYATFAICSKTAGSSYTIKHTYPSGGTSTSTYTINDGSYTYNGKTAYYDTNNWYLANYRSTLPAENYIYGIGPLAWTALYGSDVAEVPEQTEVWTGNDYPLEFPTIQVATEIDPDPAVAPEFTPYQPIALPVRLPEELPDSPTTEPGTTSDPDTNPNPDSNPYPGPTIAPFINPIVSPQEMPDIRIDPQPGEDPERMPTPEPAPLPTNETLPLPQSETTPQPEVDPSVVPSSTVTPNNPQQPEQPTDEGNTPTPVLPVSPIPEVGALGLLHVYNPTQAQIDAFGAWLWETWSDSSIWETIQKLFNDPMDGIIGLHELYATPNTAGSGTIRCGYLDSEVPSVLVGSRYTTIECGSIVIEEYYQNYLDYSPYTQCYIYLPFIGIVSVSSDDIVGNAVQITYRIDSYTGACIAIVTCAKDGYSCATYQFEGNCAVEVPITSGYQSTLMSGLLALAGTAVTGNPLSGLAAGHVGRSGLGKNEVQHSGSFGASYGAMGAKIPYIIIKRPVQKQINNYSVQYGYPAHKLVYVGNCSNFLRCKEVRVTSTTATNEEKELIVQKLKEGIYIK